MAGVNTAPAGEGESSSSSSSSRARVVFEHSEPPKAIARKIWDARAVAFGKLDVPRDYKLKEEEAEALRALIIDQPRPAKEYSSKAYPHGFKPATWRPGHPFLSLEADSFTYMLENIKLGEF